MLYNLRHLITIYASQLQAIFGVCAYLADFQSQSPRNSLAMPVALLNQIDQI